MKILIVQHSTNIAGRIYCIANSLVDQGHEVHFVLWDLPYNIKIKTILKQILTSFSSSQYTYGKFKVYKFRRLPYFWPYINGFFFSYQVKKLYKSLGADIIISETFTNETKMPKSLPYIYDLADDYAGPADIYGGPFYRFAFKLLGIRKVMEAQCKEALAVTVVSESLYRYAKQFNPKVYKVHNGVDGEIVSRINSLKAKPKNKYSMIYVTGFGPWSRPIETMQAVIKLRKKYPRLQLTLIGRGTESKRIKAFISEKKVESFIHYLGYVSDRNELFTLINESSIGLSISQKNSWRDAAQPIKVLEYSALGKKVVSTDLDEVKALNFPNVFMFTDKGKSTVESAMIKALEYTPKKDEYKSTSEFVLSNYSWDKSARQLAELAKSLKRDITT